MKERAGQHITQFGQDIEEHAKRAGAGGGFLFRAALANVVGTTRCVPPDWSPRVLCSALCPGAWRHSPDKVAPGY